MNAHEFQIYKTAGIVSAFAFGGSLQHLFPYRARWKEILGNWRNNFALGAIGALIMSAVCGGCVCVLANQLEAERTGLTHWVSASLPARILASVVVLDFMAYIWHRANHALPFLWRFHAVHHSDVVFDTSTAIRFHPGELLVSLVVRMLVVAAFGLPVLGLLLFEILYAFFNVFEHGNIRLNAALETRMAWVFVTPALHRKHHSRDPRELNTNFGTIFSVWDRAAHTFRQARSKESILVGLPGAEGERGLRGLLLFPFYRPAARSEDEIE